MNMKKSIAGVMAGALAVSAMATTVSAQDSIALTYDLKTYKSVINNGTVQLVQTWSNGSFYVTEDALNAGAITFGAASSENYIGNMKAFAFDGTPLDDNSGKSTVAGLTQTVKYYNEADYYSSGAIYTTALGGATFAMPITTSGKADAFNLANYDAVALGQSSAEDAGVDGATNYAFKTAVAKMTYEVTTAYYNKAYGSLASYLASIKGTESFYNPGSTSESVTVEILAQTLSTKSSGITGASTLAIGSFSAATEEDAVFPMKSSLKTPANIVDAITARKAGDNYYTTPLAVINDAIANHENVTFTFTSYDGYVATEASAIAAAWSSAGWSDYEWTSWITPGRAYGYKTNEYDWYNPYFSQQLYTNSYNYSGYGVDDYDLYGSYSTAWGINLFTGALVVNSGITMQLQDTDKFEWGSNTLTFDWNSITDEGKVTEAKTFLTSMLLYTPVDWYWDNLSVVVGDDETDSVDTGNEIVADDEEIDDTDIDDIVEVVEDPVEDVEVVVDPVVTDATPVVPASPATGNAPVALAVIPVALAAAAVVAKKRG